MSNNIVEFPVSSSTTVADRSTAGEILKFPYNASRHVHSRKLRKSHNGTPAQRAAKKAAGSKMPRKPPRQLTGKLWEDLVRTIGPELNTDLMIDAWKLLERYFRKL